ncbi:MAG: LptF/LptG family permease [Endomicrobium sp.]|jgi:lipopolysaccharide export LptBFGC system permease protein LptF|nr:LptF/LptG family permease [Endomicrobium sp.]
MIKKIHLYIIKEFLYSFILGIVVFSFLLMLNLVFEFTDLLIEKGIAVLAAVKMFAFFLPSILTLSIPMAALFGVLFSYGRLSSNNEIRAMKAAGFDYKTLTMPIIFFGLIISFFLVFFNHFLAPRLNSNLKVNFEQIITKKPLVKFNEKSITKLGEYKIYSNKVDNTKNTLIGVSIYKFENDYTAANNEKTILPQNDKETWRITAASATVKTYATGAQLTLYKGYWQKISPSDMTNLTHATFRTYSFFVPLGNTIESYNIGPSELPSPKLIKTIKQYKKQKFKLFMIYLRNYWIRWIFAITPIIFIVMALPIGICISKDGKALSFSLSLGIVIIYYTLFAISISLGEKEYIPLGIIIWLPNLIIGSVGLYLFVKMVKK